MNTLFERVPNGKDEWLTPPRNRKSLGRVRPGPLQSRGEAVGYRYAPFNDT